MLRSLFMVLASQSLVVFGTAQQDSITNSVKYNGPSYHYLPTAEEHNQNIVSSTRKSAKQFQGMPQHNDCIHHRLTLQRQTIPGSQNSSQLQTAARIENDLQKMQPISDNIASNQNSHHHSFSNHLSSHGDNVPIHTLYSSVLPPTRKPTATETRQSKFQDTEYYNSADLNEIPLPSQGYLPPYENLRQQLTGKRTTSETPSPTSRYKRPINKNFPVSTEPPPISSSPVYSFGNYPNNHPWNPIDTEHLTIAFKSQSTTLTPQTTFDVLRPGYRYNTPASRYLASNFQSRNKYELEMGANEIHQHNTNLHIDPDANGKTEIQTEKGYAYGQPASLTNKTYLNSVPTQPNPNQYNKKDEFQSQQNSIKDHDLQIKTLSTKANSPGQIQSNNPRLPACSYSIRNEDSRPLQVQRGHTVPNLGTFAEHPTSLNIQEYKQQLNANSEKTSSLMEQQGPGERVESSFRIESNQQTNDFEELKRRKENCDNHNSVSKDRRPASDIQQNLQGAVENISEATRYSTKFSPSAGPSHADQTISLHSHSNKLGANHNNNRDLKSQTYSRLSNGSIGYNFGDLNPHSKPNFFPNNPDSLNGIQFGLSSNEEKAQKNVEAPGQLTSGKQSPGSLNNEQQKSKYNSPVMETLQSAVFSSSPLASTTPSITPRPIPDFLSSLNQQHLPLPDLYDSYATQKPIVNEQQIFPVSNQQNSQLWHTKSIRPQNSESLNYINANISPIPQEEELQEMALLELLPYLSFGLMPPMTTIPEFHSPSSAKGKVKQSRNFYMSPSKISHADNNEYFSDNHVATMSFNRTPLNPESQGKFSQSPNSFSASKLVSGLLTPQVSQQQFIHSNNQQVFNRDHNPTIQGSIRLQTNAAIVQNNLKALNPAVAQSSHPAPLGVFPSQLQATRSQTDSGNPYEGTNSLQFLRDTPRHFRVASYTPTNFGGNPKTSLESLPNMPHKSYTQSVSSLMPQTQQQKLNTYLNEPLDQSPTPDKQFSIQNILEASGNPHNQELFLGNPTEAFKNPGSSSTSNFIGSTSRVSNRSTIRTNYKFDADNLSELDNTLPSRTFSRNSLDFVNSIQEFQRQNTESIDQPFNAMSHTNSKPMAFSDHPFREILYPAMSSASRFSPDTPLNITRRKLITQPHLVYGGPQEAPRILQI